MSRGFELLRKRTPCSYQPTAATPFFASNQCDEQLTVTGALESTAPLVNMPLSSVPRVLRRDRALPETREIPGLELALAATAARRDLAGVDVVLLGDQQRLGAPLGVVEDEVVVRG